MQEQKSKQPEIESRADRWVKFGKFFLILAKAIKTLYDIFF